MKEPEDYPCKVYLGDGAYAQLGQFHGEIVITTENGIEVQNRVVLGPSETAVLIYWLIKQKLLDPKKL